jgi:hypothetical protein
MKSDFNNRKSGCVLEMKLHESGLEMMLYKSGVNMKVDYK